MLLIEIKEIFKILDPYFQIYTLLHAERVLFRGEGDNKF